MSDKRLSKAMSGMLRHWAVDEGLDIDESGWVDIDDLVDTLDQNVSKSDVISCALDDKKGRYELRSKDQIRAVYGHSIDFISIDNDDADEIPATLYHGTQRHNANQIFEEGIKPMNRNTVQLTDSWDEAESVGDRHGDNTVVIYVDAESMIEDSREISRRGSVYTTEIVPPKYLRGMGESK